jgi:hypothetical protein
MQQPRWKDGSKGMLTVCALFAGFTGVILVNLIIHAFGGSTTQAPPPSSYLYISILLAGLALWLFALSAERITDALDHNEVGVYLFSMITYNIGVVFIFVSLDLLLFHFWRTSYAFIPLVLLLWPWGRDIWWLSSRANRNAYLLDLQKPA